MVKCNLYVAHKRVNYTNRLREGRSLTLSLSITSSTPLSTCLRSLRVACTAREGTVTWVPRCPSAYLKAPTLHWSPSVDFASTFALTGLPQSAFQTSPCSFPCTFWSLGTWLSSQSSSSVTIAIHWEDLARWLDRPWSCFVSPSSTSSLNWAKAKLARPPNSAYPDSWLGVAWAAVDQTHWT